MDLAGAILLSRQRAAASTSPVWEAATAQSGRGADGRVAINSAGLVESALCPAELLPVPGDIVAVVRAAAPLIVGILVTSTPWPRGWTSGVAQGGRDIDGRVSVRVDGTTVLAICPAGVAPVKDDHVAVIRDGTYLVVGILARPVPPPDSDGDGETPPAPPSGGPSSGVTRIPAAAAAMWRYATRGGVSLIGVERGVIEQSDGIPEAHRSWLFYQQAIKSTLAGVTVDAIRIRLPVNHIQGSAGTLEIGFADGNPTWPTPKTGGYNQEPFPAVTPLPSPVQQFVASEKTHWVDLPPELGQLMTSQSIAIGLVGTDLISCLPLADDPQSGLLEITWHR